MLFLLFLIFAALRKTERINSMKLPLVFLIICFYTSNIFAQSHDHAHDHSEHKEGKKQYHEHHKSEIGVGNSLVYFTGEEEFAFGLHVHYVRTIANSKFGWGFGYERIFDEHGHNTFGPEIAYRPIENLSISFSPGVTLEDEHPEAKLALHLETAYEFSIKNFHIGPTIGFAYDPEDYHISFGLHIGYGF